MKKLLILIVLCLPLVAYAQTTTGSQDRVAILKAEAEAKAKAAMEAAKAAQEAAIAAQKAAEAAAAEAEKAAQEAVKEAEQAKKNAEQATKEAEQVTIKTENTVSSKAEDSKKTEEKTPESVETETPAWSVPVIVEEQKPVKEVEEKAEKKKADDKNNDLYLSAEAVPMVDGKVVWTYDIDVPGKNAQQIYNDMMRIMSKMTKEENQLERSKVALVNEQEHKIAASMQEWLVFSSSFLSLDRTKMSYILSADCEDGHVKLTMERISYAYGEGKDTNYYKAEEWITDKNAVNKKHTRLLPLSGKFRKKTIDRKNEIFKTIRAEIR